MARLPRFVLPGQPQHVIQRGNNRQEIFCAEGDYRFYLDKLHGAAQKHERTIHANRSGATTFSTTTIVTVAAVRSGNGATRPR